MVSYHPYKCLVFQKLYVSSPSYHFIDVLFRDLKMDVKPIELIFGISENIVYHFVMDFRLASIFGDLFNSGTFECDVAILMASK